MGIDQEVLGGLPSETWECADAWYEHGGITLHYLDIRRREPRADAAPCALMLHGMTGHCEMWRDVVARLEHVNRVVCPDFRGHGMSDWTRDGYWLADYAGDVLALVDELGLDQVDLVGHSLGARVSMVLAPMLGDRLRSFLISDTGPEVSRSAAQQALATNSSTKSVAGFRDLDKLKAFLREQGSDWSDIAIDVRAARLYRRNYADMLVNRGDPEVTWLLGRAGLKEVDDMWAGLKAVTAPVLLLRADKSFLLDDEIMERMEAAIGRCAVARLPTGHYLPYEDVEGVARVFDGFFADPAGAVAAN